MPPFDGPQLPMRLTRAPQAIDPALVLAQPTLLGSVKLCISVAGFEADKQVYAELGIDAGHWSRVMRGEAHFPLDKLSALMDLCGNEAPLLWLVHARGYDVSVLRKRETETERSLRAVREELERERLKNVALREALRG